MQWLWFLFHLGVQWAATWQCNVRAGGSVISPDLRPWPAAANSVPGLGSAPGSSRSVIASLPLGCAGRHEEADPILRGAYGLATMGIFAERAGCRWRHLQMVSHGIVSAALFHASGRATACTAARSQPTGSGQLDGLCRGVHAVYARERWTARHVGLVGEFPLLGTFKVNIVGAGNAGRDPLRPPCLVYRR